MATTGGGSSALEGLLAVPGASRTVLEGVVPYSAAALRQFLGATPEHYCSPETARAMAMAAFQRALRLAKDGGDNQSAGEALALAGIGCTASLASDRPKKGAHRAHLAVQTAGATLTQSIELAKGRRSRLGEEKLVGRLLLNLVAETAGLSERLDVALSPDDRIEQSRTAAQPQWTQLLLGERPAVRCGADVAPHVVGALRDPNSGHGVTGPQLATGRQGRHLAPRDARLAERDDYYVRGIFPGAFNPRHEAHRQMACVAQRRLGGGRVSIEHEIAIANVDKPPLDFTEIQRRVAQFEADETLWLTSAPRFEQKAELFPGATFVVGADTVLRVGEPRYYGGDPAARDRALERIRERGCRFLVFGRMMGGNFQGLSDLDLPPSLAALCDEVPAEEFRADISSTELRTQGDLS
jgi:hypothetical protein